MSLHQPETFELAALRDSLVARLRGQPARGRAAAYEGASLGSLRTLSKIRAGLNHGDEFLGGTGSDFSNLISQATRRRVVDFMAPATSTARTLCSPVNLADFKPSPVFGVDPPRLNPVGEDGMVELGLPADPGEPARLRSVARRIVLSGQVVANDDAGALDSLARDFALSVRDAEDSRFVVVLLANADTADGVPYFDADHGNLLAGAALNATSLALASAALRAQTSATGAELNLEPWALLVGPKLEQTARALLRAVTVEGSPTPRLVVESRISDVSWYVFADPAVRPAFAIGWLDGQRNPLVIGRESFEHFGIELQVSHHFAVSPLDWRAAVLTPAP